MNPRCKVGPLPVITGFITPITRVIKTGGAFFATVTHVIHATPFEQIAIYKAIYRGYNSICNCIRGPPCGFLPDFSIWSTQNLQLRYFGPEGEQPNRLNPPPCTPTWSLQVVQGGPLPQKSPVVVSVGWTNNSTKTGWNFNPGTPTHLFIFGHL